MILRCRVEVKVALHDNDLTGYPNLALMKLAAHHRAASDTVEWFNSLLGGYDLVYSSRVFTWSSRDPYLPAAAVCGGTGHDLGGTLPEAVEHACPDYSLYGCKASYGFLTRGCVRTCEWCFVPRKEGKIRAHADIDEFVRHPDVVLMDNNVLAHPHGLDQIDKMARLGLRVDFNQGLDARLIDDAAARRLGRLKWIRHIRLACDSSEQIAAVRQAVELLRWHNVNPAQIFCYVLVRDVDDALERVRFLKGMYVVPFAQPYRAPDGAEPTGQQKAFARWCNHRAIYKTCTWDDYRRKADFRDDPGGRLKARSSPSHRLLNAGVESGTKQRNRLD
ncbi:MAG: radical SAM protein [Thermodesulfobacteriota bacterium]